MQLSLGNSISHHSNGLEWECWALQSNLGDLRPTPYFSNKQEGLYDELTPKSRFADNLCPLLAIYIAVSGSCGWLLRVDPPI